MPIGFDDLKRGIMMSIATPSWRCCATSRRQFCLAEGA
jgi:hypothetical protein